MNEREEQIAWATQRQRESDAAERAAAMQDARAASAQRAAHYKDQWSQAWKTAWAWWIVGLVFIPALSLAGVVLMAMLGSSMAGR